MSNSVALNPALAERRVSQLRGRDGHVVTIGSVAVVLAFVATLYPSWRAARVRPAEALRYE